MDQKSNMNFLSDKSILDYLMTSDFEEGLTPTEFKFLLSKFRSYYRNTNSINSRIMQDIDSLNNDKKDILLKKEELEKKLNSDIQILKNEINFIKNKKLSFKERWFGKLIFPN